MGSLFNIQVSGGTVEAIPEGKYDAVLIAIIENGVQKREPYKGQERKPVTMIKLLFEIPSLKDAEGRARVVGKEVPASFNERANLFKIFKALGVAKEPSPAELARLFGSVESINAVLGTAASLKIEHFEKADGTKLHYIAGVDALDPRIPAPESESEKYFFVFGAPNMDVFKNKLTKYARKRIMSAVNVADLPKEVHEAYIAEQEADGEEAPAGPKAKTTKAKGVI